MADLKTEEDSKTEEQSANESKETVSKTEVCRNFLKNRCNRGVYCKYDHRNPASHDTRSRSRSPIPSKGEERKDICRDFIRNLCKRGIYCRFYHPPKEEAESSKAWFTLCLDFQNGKCTRADCRYFHVSIEDEEHFRESGEIPPHILDQAMVKASHLDIAFGGTQPTCKDYLRGYCKLRVCRFRHVNLIEYENEIYNALHHELVELLGPPRPIYPPRHYDFVPPPRRMPYEEGFGRPHFDDYGIEQPEDFPPERPMHHAYYDGEMRNPLEGPAPWDERGGRPPFQDIKESFSDTEREIMLLRRELKEVREQTLSNQQGKIEQAAFDEIKSSNERFIRENSELNDRVRGLQRDNDKLTNEIRGMGNLVTKNSEVQLQLENSQREIHELKDQISKQKNQIFSLQVEQQTFDRYQKIIQEQSRNLQNQLLVVENELAQAWGGSLPNIPSLRDSWKMMEGTCNYIVKNSTMSGDSFVGGGTSGADAISNANFNRTSFNTNTLGYDGSNSAPMSHNSAPMSHNSAPMSHNSAPMSHNSAPMSHNSAPMNRNYDSNSMGYAGDNSTGLNRNYDASFDGQGYRNYQRR